jgi:hypothetical protein
MKKITAITDATPWLLALSFAALYSASAHAGPAQIGSADRTTSCQQTFHDYLDNYRGEQLQQRALQLYFSGDCMPHFHSDLPEPLPQRIPSTSRPDRLKLLQIQDADEYIITYRS